MPVLRNFARACLVFLLSFWTISCSQQDVVSPPAFQAASGHSVSATAKDFAPGQLEAHYQKHGYQFGSITIDQYLDQARGLLNTPAGDDVLEKIRPDGDVLRYRNSTGEFAVMTPRGRIRTYFKTDMRYWMRQ